MKTLAIRLEDEQHARLQILARLSESSITDVIRQALDARLAELATDPDLSQKAAELTEAIAREAAEQRDAITQLFGSATASSKAATRKATPKQ